MSDEIELPQWIAQALGLDSLSREVVAQRLAEIGGLSAPTRPETKEYLVGVLVSATSAIPSVGAAWSWGEFHNSGLGPISQIDKDWVRLAICATDLGLGTRPRPPRRYPVTNAPVVQLGGELLDATEELTGRLEKLLIEAGADIYDWHGYPTRPPRPDGLPLNPDLNLDDRLRLNQSLPHSVWILRAGRTELTHLDWCDGVIPEGTVVVVKQMRPGIVFHAVPERYTELEESLVPPEVRSREAYGGYALTFRFDDIGWILEPLGDQDA